MGPRPFDLHRCCLSAPLRSSSLAENELCPSLRSSVDGVFDGERGRCGELRLTAPSSGPSPLRPRKLPTPPLALDVSCLRIGFSGGRGGAVRPVLLSARDLGPLRDPWLLVSGDVADCCSDTVGILLVDMMNVGSEMSAFLTTLFIDSFSVLAVTLNPGVEGAEGRRGEGAKVVGVPAPEPLAPA